MIRADRLDDVPLNEARTDPDQLQTYLEDASSSPPGRAAGLCWVESEAQTATLMRRCSAAGQPLLVQAARSSLTGAAVPLGECIASVERWSDIGRVEPHPGGARVRVSPGVRLDELQRQLDPRGYYFPPVPTYRQAMIGGTVATNAGGAASFKYGVTRDWVHGLHVVLANGERLKLERGAARVPRGQPFRIALSDGSSLEIPSPDHLLPPMKKISAGYFSDDPLDLVDLFIGSEGTLGLISAIELELVPLPAGVLVGLVFPRIASNRQRFTTALREAGLACHAGDRGSPDVRSIEFVGRQALQRVRGRFAGGRLPIPADAESALLFEIELTEAMDATAVQERLERLFDGEERAGALGALFGLLADHELLDRVELAFPHDEARRNELFALREAAPLELAECLSRRRRDDAAVHKVAGDLIVPFDRLNEALAYYERGFSSRGLDYAIWGHLSDGNLHPNAIPGDRAGVIAATEAQLEFADWVVANGGCPLSEHGVGRSPLKQRILRRFLGESALATMWRVKRALDPQALLAPGVLLAPPPSACREEAGLE